MRSLRFLYPRRWRRRFGDEFDATLADLRGAGHGRLRLAFDIVRGAADAWLSSGGNGVAMRRALAVAAPASAILAAVVVGSNVVIPTKHDDPGYSVALCYLGIVAVLLVVGWRATPVSAGPAGPVKAGVLAGIVMALCTIATFFFVDNVFLATVSQQETKVHGLTRSGLSSMRLYVNLSLVIAGVSLTAFLGGAGALCGLAGSRLYQRVHG